MGLYDQNQTNTDLEKKGKWIDYGGYRIKVARAGGTNRKYLSELEAAMKPIRRAIDSGTVPQERQKAIMVDVFAKTIIMGWETWDDEKEDWVSGIEQPDGTIGKFTKELVIETLNALPSVLEDIQKDAMALQTFLEGAREEEAGN